MKFRGICHYEIYVMGVGGARQVFSMTGWCVPRRGGVFHDHPGWVVMEHPTPTCKRGITITRFQSQNCCRSLSTHNIFCFLMDVENTIPLTHSVVGSWERVSSHVKRTCIRFPFFCTVFPLLSCENIFACLLVWEQPGQEHRHPISIFLHGFSTTLL